MIFVAGAIAGVVVGFAAAVLLGRRAVRTAMLGSDARFAIALAVAALALLLAAIAVARSGRHDHTVVTAVAPPAAATTTTTSAPPTSTTPPAASLGGTVSVPNVVGQRQSDAVATLKQASFRARVNTLALPNVPPGFVVSQNPLPAGLVPSGTTVALVVSAAP